MSRDAKKQWRIECVSNRSVKPLEFRTRSIAARRSRLESERHPKRNYILRHIETDVVFQIFKAGETRHVTPYDVAHWREATLAGVSQDLISVLG